MQPDNNGSAATRLSSIAYRIFWAMAIIAPLVFLPTTFLAADLVKTVVIAVGTLVPAIIYLWISFKEKRISLPPPAIRWVSFLLALSLIISSLLSSHIAKSLFGQGFELGTASFILVVLLAAWIAFETVVRRAERAMILYVGLTIAFLILCLVHILRFILGPGFLSLGILGSYTSTLIGSWYSLGMFSFVICIIALIGLMVMPLSKKMRIIYWVVAVLSFLGTVIVNSSRVWLAAAAVFLGLSIILSAKKMTIGASFATKVKQLAWLPLIVFVVSAVFAWNSDVIVGKTVNALNAGYSELSLPWQLTLDVTSGAVKSAPLFGVGPNHFQQAYIAHKPAVVNTTDAWSVEFAFGFSLLSTFVATQGLVGAVLWLLFFVFFGILSARVLMRLPTDPMARFVLLSSFSAAVFLWLMLALTVPSHTIVLYAFLLTGLFLGSATAYGILPRYTYWPAPERRAAKLVPALMLILILVGIVWVVCYGKKTIALAYFGSGVKALSANNANAADAAFAKALAFDKSDIYWQGRTEAALAKATALAGSIRAAGSNASTTVSMTSDLNNAATAAFDDAGKAIAYDPTNYYNYISQARAAELAVGLGTAGGYDKAVGAYTEAIRRNNLNPSIYLNLARLQASQNKLDDAERTMGAALQVKNNYLDGIFLLSQIEAAKGNVKDAITATQVAIQLNPSNPLLLFELGFLQYVNKDYTAAATALEQAVKVQSDYANAKYFLGLSYIRLNRIPEAVAAFQDIAATNPDNQEVAFILNNLRQGKSPFADAQPPITSTPEKRPTLPIKERRK